MTATLDDLGLRICILGPSGSGKSTLADAIARARALAPVHLDRLHHLPDSDWVPRSEEDFTALHAAAIAGERWVIDGNYTRLLAPRLRRATGVILLDVATATSLWRYVRRCWFERDRRGGLEGGRDSVKWDMIRHILGTTRNRQRIYAARLSELPLPKLHLDQRLLDHFYRANGLVR